MSYRHRRYQHCTASERALAAPGVCTRCGADATIRNTWGQCLPCHGLQVTERKQRIALTLDHDRIQGALAWAERGVKVGQAVMMHGAGWVGNTWVCHGIAATGRGGAYVRVQDGPHRGKQDYGYQRWEARR